jgi:hypothetical protein
MMRTLARLAVVALAACMAAQPAAAQMEGSYDLVEINGQAIPAPSPSEEGVVMHGIVLQLMPDGRFSMRFRAAWEGELPELEQEFQGTFAVTADTLALTAENLEETRTIHFRFTLADGTLRLYDEHEDEYTLRRS